MEKNLKRLLAQMEESHTNACLSIGVNLSGSLIIKGFVEILIEDGDELTPTWHTDHKLRELRKVLGTFEKDAKLPTGGRHVRNFKNKVVSHMSKMLSAMADLDEPKYIRAKKRFVGTIDKYYQQSLKEQEGYKNSLYTAYKKAASINDVLADEKLKQLEDAPL